MTESIRYALTVQVRALSRCLGALLQEITMKSWMAVLLLTLVGTSPLVGQRMPPGYLKEMPDPARVLSSFDGDDTLDKTARQFGALSQLEKMVQDLSEGRFSKNQLTAEERRIWDGYNAALSRIETPHFDDAETRRLGLNSPLVKWSGLRSHYALDAGFRNELLDRFFSPAWKSSFLAVKARQDHERQAVTRRQQPSAPGRQAMNLPAANSGPLAARGADRVAFVQGFGFIIVGLLIFTFLAALRKESGARRHLNSGESVLFDTRPHFIAFVGVRRLIWFLIGSLLVPLIAAAEGEPFSYVLFFWFLLVLLPLLIRVLKWRNVFYSLTDQRMMHGHGVINKSFNAQLLTRIGGLLDVSTYRITGVAFGQGLSGRMFNFGNIIFRTNHGNISWFGIKDPLNVRRLIEEKVATFQDLGANQATYNEAIIKKVAEVRTEESFGLVGPKHDVSIQDKVGGWSLPQTPSAFRNCSNCGRQNPAEAAYCSQCGKQLH
jgi:hypothetical protein